MATKILSQKRFIKGLNAGTGVLTEPSGTVTRISNLLFVQRGSLQTIPGSAIIGTIGSTPQLNPIAMGVFATQTGAVFPFYPTLTAPTGRPYPNILANVTTNAGTGNSAGTYWFAVIGSNSGVTIHSDALASIVSVTAGGTFGSVTVSWAGQVVIGTYYSVYYLPGGPNATQGVLLAGPTLNLGAITTTANTALPTTPLVTLPTPNNSYSLDLNIGNLTPPSKVVSFTLATAVSLPGTVPQPAQISPGDPNFTYNSSSISTTTYTGGTTSTSDTQSSVGTSTSNSSAISGFPSVALSTGQQIAISLSVSASVVGNISAGGGSGVVNFQYSPDSGTTWITLNSFAFGGSSFNQSSSFPINQNITNLTNLNTLQFRVQCISTIGSGAGTVTSTGSITASSASITTTSAFTPYGGTVGLVCPIPQILQFANLAILILGNGYQPQSTNPANLSSATLTALTNTFTAAYPTWIASVAWQAGDQLQATVSGTTYVFTAQNSGNSGSMTPTWPTALGSTVADGQIIWKNDGTAVSVAPRGAAHGIVYAGSLWLANTYPTTTADNYDGPTCLKMSDSGNPNSWNPANTAFLGKDDGTQITGMATYTIAEVGVAPTSALVVYKEFSTYQILGVFGASDFQITQAKTDLGCISARSIQFLTGYGLMRFTHLGFAIFNGESDTLVSEEIRPYIFGGTGLDSDITGIDFTFSYLAQSCQISSPPMYTCSLPLQGAAGAATRLFTYDLVLKAWTIIDLPFPISTLLQARTGEGSPLAIAGRNDGTGNVERLFAGDVNWSTGVAVAWTVRLNHVFREASASRAFYRYVIVRGHSSQATAASVKAQVGINGNARRPFAARVQPQPSSGQVEIQIDLLLTAENVQLTLTGTGAFTLDGLEWAVTPKQGGAISIG